MCLYAIKLSKTISRAHWNETLQPATVSFALPFFFSSAWFEWALDCEITKSNHFAISSNYDLVAPSNFDFLFFFFHFISIRISLFHIQIDVEGSNLSRPIWRSGDQRWNYRKLISIQSQTQTQSQCWSANIYFIASLICVTFSVRHYYFIHIFIARSNLHCAFFFCCCRFSNDSQWMYEKSADYTYSTTRLNDKPKVIWAPPSPSFLFFFLFLLLLLHFQVGVKGSRVLWLQWHIEQ